VSYVASNGNFAALRTGHTPPELTRGNITFAAGAGKGVGTGLIGFGAVLVALAAGLGYTHSGGVWARQALAAYHIGAMSVLAMCLGAMFFVMVFHLTNAGWTGTIRRQFENVMSFLPFAMLMVVPTLAIEIFRRTSNEGHLFPWLTPLAAANHELQAKWTYFFGPMSEPGTVGAFPWFFVLRAALYGALWWLLSRRLMGFSLAQETSPNAAPIAKARFMSAWGMLVFALSTAFAAFDWLQSLDYRFFSTMWGVYYFAGAAFTSSALLAMVLAILHLKGKLRGAVTEEHFHDLGKLMFTFTVFWGYIGFSQYFLIWYSNIPEETAFFNFRASERWLPLGQTLIIGHFVIPFVILLFRKVKRSPKALIVMAAWAIFIGILDIYWIVRPMVYGNEPGPGAIALVVDVLGIVGVLAVFAGYLVRKIPQTNLVALNDPRMDEALAHKNYV
jgi:hypothetical protein